MKKLTGNFPKMNKKEKLFTGLQSVLILAAVLVSVFFKTTGEVFIASQTDSVMLLNAAQNELIQTWQAESKNIERLRLPIDREYSTDLTGKLTLLLKPEEETETYIYKSEIDLGEMADKEECMFTFPKTELELGRRYYFQIRLEEAGENTSLALKINSDYGGLTVEEKEIPGAAAGIVEYQKTGNLAWLLRIFLLFGGISFLLMLLFDRKFEEVLALTFGIIFVYIYLWGIFERLEFGVQSVLAIGMIAALCVPLIVRYKKKKWRELVSPGLLAFWGLFVIYFILDRNVVAGKVDDLNHWQLCVRDMWYFDSYPYHPGSTLIAMRYTPGFATIEYLFTYLYGAYREGIILLACHTIGFSMLSVLYTKINWRGWHKVLPVTVLVAGLPLLVYQSHFGILYVDAYLGIIGAYILICYFTEEHNLFNLLRITFASALLIMTKEMGLAIAGTTYLIIFIDIKLKEKGWKSFFRSRKTIQYFKSGCISLSSFISWQIYILIAGGKYGIGNSIFNLLPLFQTASDSSVRMQEPILLAAAADTGALSEAITQSINIAGVSDATPLETIKEMINWLLTSREFFGLSYGGLTLTIILMCSALGICGLYKKLDIPMKQIIISLLAGTALYAAFLVACYIFLFQEASAIPAARRYMGSYLLLFLITILGIQIVKANTADAQTVWKQPLVWIFSMLVILNIPSDHPFYTTEENFGPYFTTWKNHQTIGEVFRSFADKEEKVYYVEYQDSDLVPQYNYLTFANAVVPNLTQGLGKGWKPIAGTDAPYRSYAVEYSADDWEALLRQEYQYVYLRYVESYFIDTYGELFEKPEEIKSGMIYRVDVSGENVTLRKIAYKNLN